MNLTLSLPLPPSANVLWRVNQRTGKPYLNPVYRSWQKRALSSLWTQKPRGGFPFFAGHFNVQIAVAMGMRGDIDNRVKPTLDFLQKPAGIIANDSHTQGASIVRSPDVARGYCRVDLFDGKPLDLFQVEVAA